MQGAPSAVWRATQARSNAAARPPCAPKTGNCFGPCPMGSDFLEKSMTSITRDSLMTLEAYSKIRKTARSQAIEHRKVRTVLLGDHINVQFEDEQTIRRQIQEMLHIEKIFDEDGIQSEIDAYAPLIPDGSNWKAT